MNRIHGGIVMYVISYDIESDRIRNRIAKELENYGRRVQYSVFECRINEKQRDSLYEKLAAYLAMDEEEAGNIRFYNICGNCEEKIITLGVKEPDSKGKTDDVIFI